MTCIADKMVYEKDRSLQKATKKAETSTEYLFRIRPQRPFGHPSIYTLSSYNCLNGNHQELQKVPSRSWRSIFRKFSMQTFRAEIVYAFTRYKSLKNL